MNQRQDPDPNLIGAIVIATVSAVIVSLPACIAAFALGRALPTRRGLLFVSAVAGAGITALLYPSIAREMSAAFDAIQATTKHPEAVLHAVWPHIRSWWLLAMGIAPPLALIFEGVRPRQVEEEMRIRERSEARRLQRRERRARRAVGGTQPRRRSVAIKLGRHLDGDRLLRTKWGRASMPIDRLKKTTLMVGSPGSGKTETLLRLAAGTATRTDWSVFVLDAKGDATTQLRFEELMREAGRNPQLFPATHYDGWRGSGREITNRLIELIDWADEGGGTYYRDLSVNLIRLACTAEKGPPRSSQELLDRLDRNTLAGLWAADSRAAKEVLDFKDEHIASCRHRYRAFFDAVNGELDGTFAFEDADCGYLLLNELLYGEETTKFARFLLEDFKQYVAARKRTGHQVLLIVDEFSAIASGERVARLVEIVRSYGASLVLVPQAYEGMGGNEAAERILNAVHTTFLHAVPEPEQLVRAAGTTLEVEASVQHDAGRSLDIGSARAQHQYKVPPNNVRALRPGACFVIADGKAQRIQVAPTHAKPGGRRPSEPTRKGAAAPPPDNDNPLRL